MNRLTLYKVANGYVLEKPRDVSQMVSEKDMWVFKTLKDMNAHLHSYYNDDGLDDE